MDRPMTVSANACFYRPLTARNSLTSADSTPGRAQAGTDLFKGEVRMSWEELRRQHLQLSEAAAIDYDETYSIGNFATNSYMDYEIRLINKLALRAPDRNLAVDLGCGTGRYSYVLAEQFNQVYAYDFSPKMIEVANANKISRRVGNVFFAVRDIEREPLNLQAGSASFVISTFGMGSFVEDIEALFRRVSSMLKPQGVAIFSFYNKSALVNRLKLPWRPALAAKFRPNRDVLRVDFSGKTYEVGAHAYTIAEIERRLRDNFELLKLVTFPVLSGLFPSKVFEKPLARHLFVEVDQFMAESMDPRTGVYIIAAVRRTVASTAHKDYPSRGLT